MSETSCPMCEMTEIEIDCKMDGISIALKACFVKKVVS